MWSAGKVSLPVVELMPEQLAGDAGRFPGELGKKAVLSMFQLVAKMARAAPITRLSLCSEALSKELGYLACANADQLN